MDAVFKCQFDIHKTDTEKQMVFGWASVASSADGVPVVDHQGDVIEVSELEKAAYDFMLDYGTAGEMHERGDVGTLVESIMFTPEKLEKMGIAPGTIPYGWWVGFKISDQGVWNKIKDGTYGMFSIEGTAVREEVK